MSRYEDQLKEQVADATEMHAQLLVELRLSTYYARRGNYDRATEILSRVRTMVEGSASALLFAAINLAEGVQILSRAGPLAAMDKLKRARALALSDSTSSEVYALTNAWLANAYRSTGQWEKIPPLVAEIVKLCQSSFHETLARIALTAADCFQEMENYLEADEWYAIARNQSLALGDELTLSAVLYNRAVLKMYNIRIAEAAGRSVDLHGCRVLLEAFSAENYSAIVLDRSIPWVFDLLKGQANILQGDFASALDLLSARAAEEIASGWRATELIRIADTLRCRAMIQAIEVDDVVLEARQIEGWFDERVGSADVAIAAHSIACSLNVFSHPLRDWFEAIADDAHQKYSAIVSTRQLMTSNEFSILKQFDCLQTKDG